ncbi:MAG: prepilin-type cleavage/methylation domain-containing protein, partial [Deltaproteobacteria bacterium]|nr:prepilin-type cleavage/methylation domain-containing protein [Deltaproteobacteria bacterium]
PATMLNEVFKVGRYLRIVDSEGHEAYGVISGLVMTGTFPRVSVAPTPAVPTKETSGGVCGCTQPCVGNLVNPVVRHLYDLRTVNPALYPQYAGLFAAAGHDMQARHKGEVVIPRTELVRVELDADDNEMPTTLEVLAEYAVDLKFGLTEAIPAGPVGGIPTLVRHPIGTAPVYAIAAPLASNGTPERIRAVQIQLSIRSAKRDRDVAIAGPGGGLLRFSLGLGRGFARMRTLTADVALSNVDG